MSFKALIAQFVLSVAALASPAHVQLPPLPDGYELENPTSMGDLGRVGRSIIQNKCKTVQCHGLDEAISLFEESYGGWKIPSMARVSEDVDTNIAPEKGRELDTEIRKIRDIHPAVCDAIVAIAARDDYHENTPSDIATHSLDLARRLTSPKLDCFGKVYAVMPPSKHREDAVYDAYEFYCLNAHEGNRCNRLKSLLSEEYRKLIDHH